MKKEGNRERPSIQKTVYSLFIFAVGMLVFSYALVPLYDIMCQELGINGKPSDMYSPPVDELPDQSRTITVELMTTSHGNLTWDFYPLERRVQVHPGEMRQLAFFVRNTSDYDMTVQAIPSVAPGRAAKYIKKTECFCFAQQMLGSLESTEYPLLFHVDKDIPRDIETITLSYTMFDITNKKIRSSSKEGRLA